MLPDHSLPLNSRPGASRLPQELVDNVIGELDGDRDALKQCSLVASNWLPASSSLLLRRVVWPPCARNIDVCQASSLDEAPPPCRYVPVSENSFVLCLEILASSPRLQRFVRELVCMPPNEEHSMKYDPRGFLKLETFVDIVGHLPHLEFVNLLGVVLQSWDQPSSAESGRTLKKLFAFGRSINDFTTLFKFLSTFRRIQQLLLTVHGLFPQDWLPYTPVSRPMVEVLECRRTQDLDEPLVSSSPLSFYAGLAHNLDLDTLRHFYSDTLQPGSATIFSAAPALESLGLRARDHELSLNLDRVPPRLASVNVSCTIFTHNGLVTPPGVDGEWTCIWTTLRAATELPIRKIIVELHVFFFHPAAGFSQEDLYAEYEAMLSRITEWQTAASVLDEFARLESITFVVRATLVQQGAPLASVHVHKRYVAAMRDALAEGLPRRYVDILHVKAAASKSNA
ncbi:hypothetical protein PsYK624_157500 [Phanerochaete sordida]|uniref:F-box domain-containing protein n=1 Tax=Phanerochaete sordida TaxID=48140 RepID=A0A9P3GQV2_9APHY|nr:hypothetical protein PsYK624_157500 [Phanerochaete sordida]